VVLTTRVWNYFQQLGTKQTIFKNLCEQQSAYTGYNVHITTDMHILFVGFIAITLGFQVFRKSEEYYPYEQRMYVNVSAPSLISWATYCDVDKTGCARLVYDAVQEECIMLHDIHNMLQGIQNNGYIYISTGQRLFLSSNEGIY
jgi:hypothetical protein